MNPKERVDRTFKRQGTDKLPKGEMHNVHPVLIDRLLKFKGIECRNPFMKRKTINEILHMDIIDVGLGAPPREKIGEDDHGNPIFLDVWGRQVLIPKEGGGTWVTFKAPASTPEEMAEYVPPRAEVFSVEDIKRWKQETDFFVFAMPPGHFGPSMTLFGTERFLPWCLLNKKEIHSWMEKFCELNLAVVARQIEAGVDGILFGDDQAYNMGTIIAPELLRELFYPYTTKVVEFVKNKGVPIVFHSDGNLMDVLPDFIDMGVDGIHSIDPSAGMDIMEIKKKYGDKLILMGNVDIDLLSRGTPEQIAGEVKRLIDQISPGGGYILSSSNQLTIDVSPENALAMYGTAEKYG